MIYITEAPINTQEVIKAAQSDSAGAVNVFIGTVRNKTSERDVLRLEYEAYDAMAVKEMGKIIEQAKEKWAVQKYGIVHRKGILALGDIAVVVAISAPHRLASFQACQFVIDTLKETVPIWKKEVFKDGETWVSAHP